MKTLTTKIQLRDRLQFSQLKLGQNFTKRHGIEQFTVVKDDDGDLCAKGEDGELNWMPPGMPVIVTREF